MISALNLHNFKTHKDTRLEIGGLTVLAGTNSSGKSSVLQSLLLLRQSHMKGVLADGLELNDALCRLGNGQDVLYRLAEDNNLSIELEDGVWHRFVYDVEHSLDSTFLTKAEASQLDTPETLALMGDDFQYVSSFRGGGTSHYDRFDYEVEHHQISKKFGQGEAVAHFLYRYGGDPTFNYLDVGADKEVELAEQVEYWERTLSPGLTINVQKGTTGGFDVLYGYAHKGIKPINGLRAENIGYGLSHALPVITALVSAKPGSLVLLENPEAQLHPRGQYELASLVCRAAQHGVQVILETHSDHILSGIQLAALRYEKKVAGGIDRQKIRMYYFEKDVDTQTFVTPLKVSIDENGHLDHQPAGFFDQEEKAFFDMNKLTNHAN